MGEKAKERSSDRNFLSLLSVIDCNYPPIGYYCHNFSGLGGSAVVVDDYQAHAILQLVRLMRNNRVSLSQIALGIALAPMATLLLLGQAALADTLRTKDFRITITNNCPEGNVVCNNVTYRGVNVSTGASIQLRGKTLHTLCADGVTPCRFVGYEFPNGAYRYVVTENGRLQVYQGNKLVLDQSGTWRR